MSISGVGSTFTPTASQASGGQTNAGKAYADQIWNSNTPEASFYKDHFKGNLSAFEGYEQWIEQQGIQTMQQCADDMGASDDG